MECIEMSRPLLAPPRSLVLLAEDNHDLREMLVAAVRAEGFDVIAVPDGDLLLDYLERSMLFNNRVRPPDVVISDLHMPGFPVLDTLESLDAADARVPFILMSACLDDGSRHTALRHGATKTLEKPLRFSSLLDALHDAVSEHIA